MGNQKTVIKVGTSTLTYDNGKVNYRRIESLCKVLADLQNSGEDIMLVSSGAVGVGMGKTGLSRRPSEIKKKQALAAIGQCELMYMYDKIFGEYNHSVAQILLTADAVETETKRRNINNTIDELLLMGIIPIINENDTVSTDELEGNNFGDNDMLGAIVSTLIGADLYVIMSDIDGLYTADPRHDPTARLIPEVREITPEMDAGAGGGGTALSTGGMHTKLIAARICMDAGADMIILNGSRPALLYDVLDGQAIGTRFIGRRKT